MFVGKVIGVVVSSCKEENLKGLKLMVVEDIYSEKKNISQIAIDAVGAGIGDYVVVTIDGGAARQILDLKNAPINNAIIGIVDYPELYNRR